MAYQERAAEELAAARRRGITVDGLSATLLGGRGSHARRTLPTGDDDSVANEDSTHSASSTRRRPRPQTLNAAVYRGRSVEEDDRVTSFALSRRSALLRESSALSSARDRTPIVECRDKSTSAWLHFPHIELVFLLFAYEGAVAAQVSAIRHIGLDCPSMFVTATVILVRCTLFHSPYQSRLASQSSYGQK